MSFHCFKLSKAKFRQGDYSCFTLLFADWYLYGKDACLLSTWMLYQHTCLQSLAHKTLYHPHPNTTSCKSFFYTTSTVYRQWLFWGIHSIYLSWFCLHTQIAWNTSKEAHCQGSLLQNQPVMICNLDFFSSCGILWWLSNSIVSAQKRRRNCGFE